MFVSHGKRESGQVVHPGGHWFDGQYEMSSASASEALASIGARGENAPPSSGAKAVPMIRGSEHDDSATKSAQHGITSSRVRDSQVRRLACSIQTMKIRFLAPARPGTQSLAARRTLGAKGLSG